MHMSLLEGTAANNDGNDNDRGRCVAKNGKVFGVLPLPADKSNARRLARLAALGINTLGLLLMLAGCYNLFSLSSKDAAYGDGCGCSPPSFRSGGGDQWSLSYLVDSDSVNEFRASERNGSALECYKPASASSSYFRPNWCTPQTDAVGKIDRSDGESCTVGGSECKGVCAPTNTGSSTAGTCALSDYSSGVHGWFFEVQAISIYVGFILVVVLLTTSSASYTGMWEVTMSFVVVFGAIALYSARSNGGYMYTFLEPMMGLTLVLGLAAFWFASSWLLLCAGAWYLLIYHDGYGTTEVSLEGLRFVFPIITGILLQAVLVLQCRGGTTGGAQGLAARMSHGLIVSPTVGQAQLNRLCIACSTASLLAVLNLVNSTGAVWYLMGSLTEYLDCSDFSYAELLGLRATDNPWLRCREYAKGMQCGRLPNTSFTSYGGPSDVCYGDSNARLSAPADYPFMTGLATTTDPLLDAFRHFLMCYKCGLFLFAIGSLSAYVSSPMNVRSPGLRTAPELPWRTLTMRGVTWLTPLLATGLLGLLASLLLGIGLGGMSNLDAKDVLYGNGNGGPPPFGPLGQNFRSESDITSIIQASVNWDDYLQATAFNQSTQPASDASNPDLRSKTDGAACTAGRFCKSGICEPIAPDRQDHKVCVLGSRPDILDHKMTQNYAKHTIYGPLNKPIWSSLGVAIISLLPSKLNGMRIAGPGAACAFGAASLAFNFRAWIHWTFYSQDLFTLQQIYMSLVDCSAFSENEMQAANMITALYYDALSYQCYISAPVPPPPPASTSSFAVTSGSCTLDGRDGSSSSSCVTSPNYPSNYDHDEDCAITVSGSAFLSAVTFDTESSYDYLSIDGHHYSGPTGPMNVPVTPSTSISWHTDHIMQRQGFKVCLTSSSAPTPSGGMMSTLVGITSNPPENPVLSNWTSHATCFMWGLYMSAFTALLTILLAFPITLEMFANALDFVCCWGRCCGTIAHKGTIKNPRTTEIMATLQKTPSVQGQGLNIFDGPVVPLPVVSSATSTIMSGAGSE